MNQQAKDGEIAKNSTIKGICDVGSPDEQNVPDEMTTRAADNEALSAEGLLKASENEKRSSKNIHQMQMTLNLQEPSSSSQNAIRATKRKSEDERHPSDVKDAKRIRLLNQEVETNEVKNREMESNHVQAMADDQFALADLFANEAPELSPAPPTIDEQDRRDFVANQNLYNFIERILPNINTGHIRNVIENNASRMNAVAQNEQLPFDLAEVINNDELEFEIEDLNNLICRSDEE